MTSTAVATAHPAEHPTPVSWTASHTVRLNTLIVLDGPSLDQQMLRSIQTIVRLCGADVVLLRSLERRLAPDPLEDPLTDAAMLAEARRYLGHVAQQLAIRGVNITTRVTVGSRGSEAIAETARQCASDVILFVDG